MVTVTGKLLVLDEVAQGTTSVVIGLVRETASAVEWWTVFSVVVVCVCVCSED